jgi:Imm-5 like putative immunity protein
VILRNDRDPRFITIRRGGTLTEANHRLLALWAAACADHVLHLFESVQPSSSQCSLRTLGPAGESSRSGHGLVARFGCLSAARRAAMPWLRQER